MEKKHILQLYNELISTIPEMGKVKMTHILQSTKNHLNA